MFLERVEVVSTYDFTVRSPSFEMRLPSVVALKSYIAQDRAPAFTRFNLFLRDAFACQYCGSQSDLTFDHILPRSRGGRTSWENIVTACAPCNLRKGGRTPKEASMTPARPARRPTMYELQDYGRRFPPNFLHRKLARLPSTGTSSWRGEPCSSPLREARGSTGEAGEGAGRHGRSEHPFTEVSSALRAVLPTATAATSPSAMGRMNSRPKSLSGSNGII